MTPRWATVGFACLVLLAGAVGSPHIAGLVIAACVVTACSPFFWRSGVYVTEAGVTCQPIDGRKDVYEWSYIKGFEVAPAVERLAKGFAVYMLLIDGHQVRLPSMRAPARYRPKMEQVCAALETARSSAQALHRPVPAASVDNGPPDVKAARATLAKARLELLLIGTAGIAAGVVGWASTSDMRFWGLAAIGAAVLASVIPIHIGMRAADKQADNDGAAKDQ